MSNKTKVFINGVAFATVKEDKVLNALSAISKEHFRSRMESAAMQRHIKLDGMIESYSYKTGKRIRITMQTVHMPKEATV